MKFAVPDGYRQQLNNYQEKTIVKALDGQSFLAKAEIDRLCGISTLLEKLLEISRRLGTSYSFKNFLKC